MTPSVLMCSTSHKRDFAQGNSRFFFFSRAGGFFGIGRSPMPRTTKSREKTL